MLNVQVYIGIIAVAHWLTDLSCGVMVAGCHAEIVCATQVL